MKIKLISIIIALTMVGSVAAGCNKATVPASSETDVDTSASIVSTVAGFEKAISLQGTWIIAITKNLQIDKDLVLDGDFKNGKKDDSNNDVYQRKIALYTQDDSGNITARFTLTSKSLTIKSKNASIQHGTYIGDLYVDVENFQLIDAKIEGNVYFSSAAVKDSFKMDGTSSVTGKQELKS